MLISCANWRLLCDLRRLSPAETPAPFVPFSRAVSLFVFLSQWGKYASSAFLLQVLGSLAHCLYASSISGVRSIACPVRWLVPSRLLVNQLVGRLQESSLPRRYDRLVYICSLSCRCSWIMHHKNRHFGVNILSATGFLLSKYTPLLSIDAIFSFPLGCAQICPYHWWREEATQIQTWNCSFEVYKLAYISLTFVFLHCSLYWFKCDLQRNSQVSEEYRVADSQASFPKIGSWDCSGLQGIFTSLFDIFLAKRVGTVNWNFKVIYVTTALNKMHHYVVMITCPLHIFKLLQIVVLECNANGVLGLEGKSLVIIPVVVRFKVTV